MTTVAVRPTRPRGAVTELIAVLLMTVGSVLVPAIGWLVGVVLLWFSPLLHWREKLLATLVVPGGPVLAFLIFGFALAPADTGTCATSIQRSDGSGPVYHSTCGQSASSGLPYVLIAATAILVLAPIVVDVAIYRRAARRARSSAITY